MTQATDLLTTYELSSRLGVSRMALAHWRVRGRGPRFIKRSGRILYRKEDVIAFEQARDRLRTSTRDD